MASRDVVPKILPKGGGEVKKKNGQADGRNRRALGDIGNLVTVPAVGAKPQTKVSRPVARRFASQLIAKEQEPVQKNKKKPLVEVTKGVAARKAVGVPTKAEAIKKDSVKAKADIISVIRPDEDAKTIEEIPLNERKVKKSEKTLTSILTARSKAACGVSNKPKLQIADIDTADVDNHLAAVEYVEDLYKFYKLTEDEHRPGDYMDSQPEINARVRAILVDWLIEAHKRFELRPESLYLTVNIMDRFFSEETLPRRELQLLCISSMLIACKYEEIWAPEVNDFLTITDNAYVRDQILVMEKTILEKLEWYLTVPTPYVFLVRYIKAAGPSDQEMENMTFFLAELGLMNYMTVISYCPSKLAASAVYAARATLNKSPRWTDTLKHHTGYSEEQLMECAKQLVSFHSGAAENKLKAVYRKFSSPDRGAVALLAPARDQLAPSRYRKFWKQDCECVSEIMSAF
ncbi:G2/mitotic-specific cyclin S13-7-like isoform X3 [Lycium ferocissimum]|uniref:G2/mitotic-specific cyclin S13-7-like isoform X3 n=1 Tax=Lycium ferocissimum TaxID=112874 RepID=UPI0028168B98|nr:G2/mitotic-specific cyclin S13-7-like isoform X3 [Lycium ferocissimum]